MITPHRYVIASVIAFFAAGLATSAQPMTDNAALLYYQACLLYAQPDGTLEQMLADFRDAKIASNEAIRKHIEANRRVIGLVVKAADLPRCDWGYDYSEGLDITLTHLGTIRHITFLIAADARLLAEQGDYQTAIERCMTIYKMGRQETDRMAVTYLVGVSMSALANRTIQDLLAGISKEPETLNRLRAQLTQIQEAFPSVQYAITQEGQVCAASIRKEKAQDTAKDLSQDEKNSGENFASERILAGDEAFFARNRAHWLNAITGVVAVLDSKLPYVQMRAKLEEFTAQTESSKNNPDATFTVVLLPGISRIYLLTTRLQAQFNALQTAIRLYAIRASTGQLPDVLPADAPGDPFSGKAFIYERAGDHFTLRCQEKEEPAKAEANQYEFKLRHD